MKNIKIWSSTISENDERIAWDSYRLINNRLDLPAYDPHNQQIAEFIAEHLKENLYNERDILSGIETNDIIAIADIGRWNGRRAGYKDDIKSVPDCLTYNGDDTEFYIDSRYDLILEDHDHDGTTYVTFREWRDISDKQKENFTDKIIAGKATRKDVIRYTKPIGGKIMDVYGL